MSEHAETTETAVIEQLAEHRLDWSRIEDRIGRATAMAEAETDAAHHLGPYVALSRMHGAGGPEIARLIGDGLGWPVLDGEIVDLVAETFDMDRAMVHILDEARSNWVRDVLGDLMPQQVLNRDTYVHHLGKVIRLVGLHGQVVIVGRGAQLFLPRRSGLAVRLVAPELDRVRQIAHREHLERDAARREVADVDRRRARFLDHYFGRDIDDPQLYDVILNTSTMEADEVAQVVVDACRRRGYTL